MGIGARIEKRLEELGWKRKDLLDAVDNLTPQALSNLICRDSKRSEWDEAIAQALGMHVMDLVYGKKPDNKVTAKVTSIAAQEPPATIQRLVEIASSISQEGQYILIGRAEEIALKYPRAKANHAS